MAIDAERQKYLDRVLKLLALADGTSFAGEAAAARAMAEELLARHNLSIGEGSTDRTAWNDELWTPWGKGAQWEFIIADALAALCACVVYFRPDFEVFRLVGSIADLEALRYLLGEVSRQRMRAWLEYKAGGGSDKLWSFCYSFARGLEKKVDIFLDGAVAIEAQRAKVKLWWESTHEVTEYDLIEGQGASTAGRTAGESTSLHRGSLNQAQRRLSHRT